MIGKVLLNLKTKLARLEVANDKLADAYEQSEKTDAAEQLQSTLDEESEFTDSIIGKISHLKLLKETVERKRREMEATQSQSLESRLTRMQEQVQQLQTARSRPSNSLASIWTATGGHTKPPNLDIAPFRGDVLRWQEFWDMFEAAIDRSDYAPVDKLNYLKSKLTGEALEAVSGYQLTNENYPVVVGVLKQRFGNKQVIIDAHYHSLSHLPPATNHVASLRQCYDTLERHLRSLEAIGENVNHHHFVALISEKLPQKVLYQLYMLRADGEEWTVPKLRSLLGKHITALEMAGSESCFTQASSRPSNKQSHRAANLYHPRPTAGGLLAGTSKGTATLRQQPQPKCIYCNEPHWSDECTKYTTLQSRRDKLIKGFMLQVSPEGPCCKEL